MDLLLVAADVGRHGIQINTIQVTRQIFRFFFRELRSTGGRSNYQLRTLFLSSANNKRVGCPSFIHHDHNEFINKSGRTESAGNSDEWRQCHWSDTMKNSPILAWLKTLNFMLLDSHLAKCCTWFDRPFNALQLCLCVDRHATLDCKVFIKLAAINTRAEEESAVGQSWLLIQPTPSAISQAPPTVDELGRWLLFLTCQPPTERWLDLSLSHFFQRKSWTFRIKLKLTKRANIQFLKKKKSIEPVVVS